MDKSREVKRQRRASGHKFISALNGGYVDFSEKSKKNKIRDSSILGRENSSDENMEMGGGSEREDEIRVPISRRIKLHGKASDGCNGVDPAAVPRKLRSAINKRNGESISPPWRDAKKQHRASNGTDSPPQVHAAMKSKQNINQRVLSRCPKQVVATTKDEEEVAETLFALASMLPFEKPVKSSLERRTAVAKNSPLRETRASSLTLPEASKEETIELPCVSIGTETTSLLLCKEQSLETEKIEPVTKPIDSERPTISGTQKFDLELTTSQNVQLTDHTQNVQLSDAVNSLNPVGVSSELHSANGSLQPTQPDALPLQKLETMSWPELPAAPKQEPMPIKDNKECSLPVVFMEEGAQDLWRGLPNGPCDVHGDLTRSSSAKAAAAWSDSVTFATRLSSTVDGVSTQKLTPPPISVERRPSWKRCTTHVHISRFISDYKSSEKKSRWQTPPNQSRLNEGTKSSVTATNNLTGQKNGVDNIISTGRNGLAIERSSHEARIDFLLDNRLVQDQQASAISGINAKPNQGFDFLSLSEGCESNNPRNGLESPAQFQVPYMLSPIQHHSIMPVSIPHTPYSSSYHDQLTTAQQLQLSQYTSSPFYGPQLGHPTSAKQQQHQPMWATQMAHYWPGIPSSHLPKWQQNGKHYVPSVPPPPPSLELLGGAKYSACPQQLYAVSSSSYRGKR